MLIFIVVLGVYPDLIFSLTNPTVTRIVLQIMRVFGGTDVNPGWDFHAIAPIIIVSATIVVVLIADFFFEYRGRFQTQQIATLRCARGDDPGHHAGRRRRHALDVRRRVRRRPVLARVPGFFLAAAYVSMLLSVDYIGDGDYYQGEYYVLLLTSLLGMMVMASARDLVSIFVALETISIPTFVLAGWRKHDPKSNEAAIKYYLIGVLSSAVMLYGMSLVFGLTGSTLLTRHRGEGRGHPHRRCCSSPAFLTIVGFAFKVERGAVPLLGAGHLRGRAHAGDRVPVGRRRRPVASSRCSRS